MRESAAGRPVDKDHVYGSAIIFHDGSSVSSIAGSGVVTFDAGPLNPEDPVSLGYTDGKSFQVQKIDPPS